MDNHVKNGASSQFPLNTVENHSEQEAAELDQLRQLLLGLDAQQIQQLYQLLNESSANPEAISRLLPDAVRLCTHQDNQLGEAIVSTVEHAIYVSVNQDIQVLSGAMFPIIVPATRKAVANAFEEMIQSLNQTLEHSLSPQSFRWRWEAKRTGKSFAEVVLLRTLVYRVEQVFLIHRETGLLLKHMVAPEVTAQDPDLVSAMLTAIQDFMRDSFRVDRDQGLQSLQFGELTIWVEASPHAVLAGIIRGNAPLDLRAIFQTALSKIHLQFNRALIEFKGDSQIFDGTEYLLNPCLEARYKKQTSNKYIYALTFFGLIAIALGIWGFLSWRSHLRWQNFLSQVRNQPGLVINKSNNYWGKYVIEGMRDPLAIDPKQLLENANINPQEVDSHWKPFISLEPELIGRRVAQRLSPPSTVNVNIDTQGNLTATGYAPQTWINRTRQTWQTIPGVHTYNDSQLTDLDLNRLNQYKSELEQETLQFSEGSTQLLAQEAQKLVSLQGKFTRIYQAAKLLKYDARVEIIGHTDSTGSDTRNQALSQERANAIAVALINAGIDSKSITIKGIGSQEPIETNPSLVNTSINRRVSFKIFLTRKSQQ